MEKINPTMREDGFYARILTCAGYAREESVEV
jgi:hypothetical protein